MDFLRRIWAVIIGTGAGVLAGIVLDWCVQNDFIPAASDNKFIMYPWVAGGGALLGALIAALIIRLPRKREQKAESEPRRQVRSKVRDKTQRISATQQVKGGSEIPSRDLGSIKLEHVEGMPGFEFNEPDGGTEPQDKQAD